MHVSEPNEKKKNSGALVFKYGELRCCICYSIFNWTLWIIIHCHLEIQASAVMRN
jgi:hypothetical protein